MSRFLTLKSCPNKFRTVITLTLLCLSHAAAWANCGAAVCLLNTDWDAQGMPSDAGLRFDLRYENIRQDKLRAGTKVVDSDAVSEDIVPLKTVDHNLQLRLDVPINPQWAISASLPIVQRTHTQLTRNADGSETVSDFKLNGLGDMHVMGRLVLLRDVDTKTGGRAAGLSFGLKLPTGKHNIATAEGELAEPGLQPGTGTTDALLGAYYNQQSINSGWGFFVRGQYQAALNGRDDYKPGAKLALDAGTRYELNNALTLQLQANALHSAKASGIRAEPDNTGGTLLTLSPGVSYAVARDVKLYAFYQRPVYQSLNGVQLSTTDSFALGISTRF